MTIELCQIHESFPKSPIITPRLKGLHCISARQLEKPSTLKGLYINSYYTLLQKDGKEFYKSNIVKNSLNPTWNPLDTLSLPSWINLQTSDFIIKVWAVSNENGQIPLFKKEINGKYLVYVGTEINELKSDFEKNSIIFEYSNGYYIQCLECSKIRKDTEDIIDVFKVDYEQVKKSYSADILLSLNKIQQQLRDERNKLEIQKNNLKEKIKASEEKNKINWKIIDYREESTLMENQLVINMLNIEENARRTEEFKCSNNTRKEELNKKIMEYENQRKTLDNQRKEFEYNSKQKENQLKIMHSQRLAELINDLLRIYPIEPSISDPLIYTIGGITLPNSKYEGYDLESIATALGYTCHLVTIIANYLDVILRYPIKYMSSRSTIIDPISMDLQSTNEFPLYTKNANFNRFVYGVFLLNKNIEQLLNYPKQNVSNLRNTLPNLRILIYKLIQTGSKDTLYPESCADSAKLNNSCFRHIIQTINPDQYFYSSSIGSSTNYLSTSHYYQSYNLGSNNSNNNIINSNFTKYNNNNNNLNIGNSYHQKSNSAKSSHSLTSTSPGTISDYNTSSLIMPISTLIQKNDNEQKNSININININNKKEIKNKLNESSINNIITSTEITNNINNDELDRNKNKSKSKNNIDMDMDCLNHDESEKNDDIDINSKNIITDMNNKLRINNNNNTRGKNSKEINSGGSSSSSGGSISSQGIVIG